MGIEQIQLAKTKALLPAFQFNWSQMESACQILIFTKRKSAPLKIKGCGTQISLRYFKGVPPARLFRRAGDNISH